MSWEKYLSENRVVKNVSLNEERNNIRIEFQDTEKVLFLVAESECCDANSFIVKDIEKLIGTQIHDISEGKSTSIKSDGYDCKLHFNITISYNYDDILNELREKNLNWNKLPKDIVKLISNQLRGKYVFIRENTSNGYYSGYFRIILS